MRRSRNQKLGAPDEHSGPGGSVRKNAEKIRGISSPFQAQLGQRSDSAEVNQGELKGTMVNLRDRGHTERDRSCLSSPYCKKPHKIRPLVTFRVEAKSSGGKMCGKARRTRNAE
jgi:hypothetical protein